MNLSKVDAIFLKDRKPALLLLVSILTLVALTLIQDYIESLVQNSGYYLSESFLFSSFSWLFAPIVFLQYQVVHKYPSLSISLKGLGVGISVLLHLLFYPLFVWILSSIFYSHTFTIQQTLEYALSQKLFLLVVIYSGIAIFYSIKNKFQVIPGNSVPKNEDKRSVVDTILITDGAVKRALAVSEIYYISANPPYVTLHLTERKFLHNETLKAINQILSPAKFVRIHKSTIVNISKVISYVSRGNGDYDLLLKNNKSLRVSRNFAADFKSRFEGVHQDTTV